DVASTLKLATDPITGGVVSATVTVNVLVLVFPEESFAVIVTVVTPSANVLPEAGLAVTTGAGSTASVADGKAKLTTAPAGDVASTVKLNTDPLSRGVLPLTVPMYLLMTLLLEQSFTVMFSAIVSM